MGFTYILSNKKYGTLYIGVTNDLCRRVFEHKNEFVKGFTQRYEVHRLVYYREFASVVDAIANEKKLKNLKRRRKLQIIQDFNPEWRDLYYELF